MRKILLFMLVTLSYQYLLSQTDIIDARNAGIGATVTIEGIVTNGDELGPIRYIQDGTGGLPAYSPGNFADEVQKGDLVRVTGVIKDFNSLLEIDPVNSYEVISTGNPLPAPNVILPNDLEEDLEGTLVQIKGVSIDGGGGTYASTTYTITVNGQSTVFYLRADHPLIGEEIPLASVDLTGIVSSFRDVYQLLPRGPEDVVIADNFFFSAPPVQSNIDKTSFTVSWETNEPSSSMVRYGTDPDNLDQMVSDGNMVSQHSLELTGLEAGNIYYVEAVSERNGNTISAPVQVFATVSNSSGTIQVYFNKSVDYRVSTGGSPVTTNPGAAEAAIISAIDNAQSTIDVSVYNNNRRPIVDALTAAHNRGVVVRYVTNIGTANLALSNPSPPFRVLQGNPDRLMHNKFIVVDRDSEQDAWLIMGSMNLTDVNIAEDYNNMLFIQDQTIARAFTIEFEEMWGSNGPTPGIFAAKFGENKVDNTPHQFLVNGTPVEVFFSPSDKTTQNIERVLLTADTDIEFAILSFTRNDLGAAIADKHFEGVNVRGMIENTGDQGTEFTFFQDQGLNVLAHNYQGSLHHKYAIVDATNPASDPTVITGSHNWSTSAETGNDESTIMVYDATISNIFLQEFEQRWCEVATPGDCLTNIFEKDYTPLDFQIMPNPVQDQIQINLSGTQNDKMVIKLFDANGQLIRADILPQTANHTLQVGQLATGIYYLQLISGDKMGTQKVIKQ
jgi:phosphatidylserine/phosphatidylglycerophosphate/cardiolipin synthase-like enzyme